ncbi:hypothetical protein CEQ30_17455 [Nocardia brasiliensis]|uniref:hypothetical protein n=1 Tax=Nocardia brasiliensis TaxID=37326 RepID=UPI0009DD3196|nr:hypothetical protein [Nocardia brasiliensis]ASF08860.1 hypothetical protein CEQ30_17455 [Nocardia brasiliensis]
MHAFEAHATEADLDELRARLAAARLPEPHPVAAHTTPLPRRPPGPRRRATSPRAPSPHRGNNPLPQTTRCRAAVRASLPARGRAASSTAHCRATAHRRVAAPRRRR